MAAAFCTNTLGHWAALALVFKRNDTCQNYKWKMHLSTKQKNSVVIWDKDLFAEEILNQRVQLRLPYMLLQMLFLGKSLHAQCCNL